MFPNNFLLVSSWITDMYALLLCTSDIRAAVCNIQFSRLSTFICEAPCAVQAHAINNKRSDWRSLVPEPLLSSVVEYLCVA